MARNAAAAVALAALVAAGCARAQAQNLARLTVQSFVLAADTSAPKADVPFHLILTLRVRERVGRIANLNLPMLAELDLLGDERETSTTPRGTEYRETITVVAHHAGAIAIAPATLQAIDARDGKPKQWYTNGLALTVAATGSQLLRTGARVLREAAVILLWLVVSLLAAAGVALAAVLLLRRRRRFVPEIPAPPPSLPVMQRSRREQAQDALTVLRAERSRPAAVAVRAAIWRMAGASEGETLGDVLRRPDSSDETMRHLLISLERSAFTYDDDLAAAIEDACSALERYIGSAE